jgi:hypothetical protein
MDGVLLPDMWKRPAFGNSGRHGQRPTRGMRVHRGEIAFLHAVEVDLSVVSDGGRNVEAERAW